jgi:hypothetical protein
LPKRKQLEDPKNKLLTQRAWGMAPEEEVPNDFE